MAKFSSFYSTYKIFYGQSKLSISWVNNFSLLRCFSCNIFLLVLLKKSSNKALAKKKINYTKIECLLKIGALLRVVISCKSIQFWGRGLNSRPPFWLRLCLCNYSDKNSESRFKKQRVQPRTMILTNDAIGFVENQWVSNRSNAKSDHKPQNKRRAQRRYSTCM